MKQNVSALQVAMNDVVVMCCCQPGTELARDVECLGMVQLSFSCEPVRQGLTIDKLHGEEVDFTVLCLRCMNLIHEADIVVAHLERTLQLGRQESLEAGLRRFDRDTEFALAVV